MQTTIDRRHAIAALDDHEEEILRLLALGCTQRAIAHRIGCHEVMLSRWLSRWRRRWLREQSNKEEQ